MLGATYGGNRSRAINPCSVAGLRDSAMTMRVVLVRHVRVRVTHGFMPVSVAVRPGRHQRMDMTVVAIIVHVRMLMFQRLVNVAVRVALGQVQHDAGRHQRGAGQHPDGAAALAQAEGDCGTHERRERKH